MYVCVYIYIYIYIHMCTHIHICKEGSIGNPSACHVTGELPGRERGYNKSTKPTPLRTT